MADSFKILGVPRETATPENLKKAYKKLCLKHHPDKNKANEAEAQVMFVKVGKAYEEACDIVNGIFGTRKTAFENFTPDEPVPADPPTTKRGSPRKRRPRVIPKGQENQEDVNAAITGAKIVFRTFNKQQKELTEALIATKVFDPSHEIFKVCILVDRTTFSLATEFEEELINVYYWEEEVYDIRDADLSDEDYKTFMTALQSIKDRMVHLRNAVSYLRGRAELPLRPDWIKTRSDYEEWYSWSGWQQAVDRFIRRATLSPDDDNYYL
jgi:DnaJ domain